MNELRMPILTGQTRPESWRRIQLERFSALLEGNETEIIQALNKDLGKPPTEAFFEIIALRQELKVVQKNLTKWMRPKNVHVPLSLKPGEAMVKLEPLGCVLIIGPWNYPFSLTLQPLISALAAGNTAILKPSEHAPATSKLIADLVGKYLPSNIVRVVQGDGKVAANLLEQPFDHIFFTGGGKIGKKVMAAASKHLTPVTLELGGKSPAIVIEGADLKVTARRLVWGKGLNAGQTCIAPDHLLLQKQLKGILLNEMENAIKEFYGANPLTSQHLGKIVNSSQYTRLKNLLVNAKAKGQILFGGEFDDQSRCITPTLIEVKSIDDPLMAEELFGPLMPIISISNLQEAINNINSQPRPLALYMFGGSTQEQQKLVDQTSSGGVCFNDVVMQAGVPELPFGGVGASGMGQYHGKAGFETFSHQKSILKRPFWMDIKFRYPPYSMNISMLKRLLG
ncbi:aldehyde dehydrogenase family protein [Prochlorococcus sp. MIT 1307]|uniref:aldehyde dehydrogenase family protein n=1 Tax=Prochlorococcus sp. MIT 1307 TaxID=3096219 RepID=UPI002A75E687|nr:aldehyde dehydrogenase family protein [Prochlorococcus sp. MIT 1307]